MVKRCCNNCTKFDKSYICPVRSFEQFWDYAVDFCNRCELETSGDIEKLKIVDCHTKPMKENRETINKLIDAVNDLRKGRE